MSDVDQTEKGKTSRWMRRIVNYFLLLLAVFLLGFIPMWLKSLENSTRLSDAERQLNLAVMQNALASAVIDAKRGDYERARQSVSEFFSSLQAENGKGNNSALSRPQREETQPLLTRRDEIITLLARSDPASAELLTEAYLSYRNAMNK